MTKNEMNENRYCNEAQDELKNVWDFAIMQYEGGLNREAIYAAVRGSHRFKKFSGAKTDFYMEMRSHIEKAIDSVDSKL